MQCWGQNDQNQLGNGVSVFAAAPVSVAGITSAATVGVGGYHSCAALVDGTVRCWGSNSSGQLGDGTQGNTRAAPVVVAGLPAPGVMQVVAGVAHTCALVGDGTVRCWGLNDRGQLGDGGSTNSVLPVLASGLTGVASVSARGNATCAVKTDGTVWCWGDPGSYGVLGNGVVSPNYQRMPVQVAGVSAVRNVAVGGDHVCASLQNNGAVCWGRNDQGQLGNGTTTNSLAPVAVVASPTSSTSPLTNVASVGVSNSSSCALLEGNVAKCWGNGVHGELGNGLNANSAAPVPVGSVPPWTTCTTVSTTASPASTAATLGDSIAFTSTAAGCGTAEFEIYRLQPDQTWRRESSAYSSQNANYVWSSSNGAAGGNRFKVLARAVGSSQPYEAQYVFDYSLQSPDACNSLTVSATPGSHVGTVGSLITLTSTSTGCIGTPQYYIRHLRPDGSWQVDADWSTNNSTWTWDASFDLAGWNQFEVMVRSQNSTRAYEEVRYLDYYLLAGAGTGGGGSGGTGGSSGGSGGTSGSGGSGGTAGTGGTSGGSTGGTEEDPATLPLRGNNGRGPRTDLDHLAPEAPLGGSIPGSSSVENGVYRYSIPIRVPEGADGLQPELSLNYSSEAADGQLGVGWSIGGLSAISRCAHNMASDGYTHGWDYNDNHSQSLNKYCLDGQKLVPLSRSASVVTYQTEQATATRVRGHFSASNSPDPQYFTVEMPNGDIRYYGATPEAPRPDIDHDMPMTLIGGYVRPWVWYLLRVERHGRTMELEYERTVPGQADPTEPHVRYPAKIKYSNRLVRFVWENRPDVMPRYAFGFDMTLRKRLTRIESYSPATAYNPNESASRGQIAAPTLSSEQYWYSASATWQYLLQYERSLLTTRSQLTKIYLAGKKASNAPLQAMPPTTFSWNQPSSTPRSSFQLDTYDVAPGQSSSPHAQALLRDLHNNRLLLGDLDGDGIDDAIYAVRSLELPQATRLYVRFGTLNGLGPETDQTASIYKTDKAFTLKNAMATDLDGDGRAELLLRSTEGQEGAFAQHFECPFDKDHHSSPFRAFRWGSAGFEEVIALRTLLCDLRGRKQPYTGQDPPDPSLATWGENKDVPIMLGDFNGDGVVDLFGGASWAQTPPGPGSLMVQYPQLFCARGDRSFMKGGRFCTRYSTHPFITGDADGDGRVDFLGVQQGTFRGERNDFLYITSDWSKLSISSEYYSWDGTYQPNDSKRLLDINGDGIDDVLDLSEMRGKGLCGSRTVSFKTIINNGRADFARGDAGVPESHTIPISLNDYATTACQENSPALYANSIRTTDLNGDGIVDLLLLNPGVGSPSMRLDTGTSLNTKFVAYEVPPVFLRGTGTGFVPGALPYAAPRLRQLAPDCWHRNEDGDWVGDLSCYRSESDWDFSQTGDINGDGIGDLVQFVVQPSGQLQIETITHITEPGLSHRRDVIVAVKNGLEQGTQGDSFAERIEYSSAVALEKNGAYHCDALADMPAIDDPADLGDMRTVCPKKGLLLVKAHLPSGRVMNNPPVRFAYDTGVMDVHGRGFLGFKRVNRYDPLLGVKDTTSNEFVCELFPIEENFRTPPASCTDISSCVGGDGCCPAHCSPDSDSDCTDPGIFDAIPAGPKVGRACYARTTSTQVTKTELPQSELLAAVSVPGDEPLPVLDVVTTTQRELALRIASGMTQTSPSTFQVRTTHVLSATRYSPASSVAELTDDPAVEQLTDYTYNTYGTLSSVSSIKTAGADYSSSSTGYILENHTGTTWAIGLPQRTTTRRELVGGFLNPRKFGAANWFWCALFGAGC
ncbi:MAG: SpvB/TcaC N-terminal domain-containing protein [Myxococcota bacterium]